tara:strand:- start:3915 stop:4535 length:621 start_codon:yes stop_codon:yes gene_type:complete
MEDLISIVIMILSGYAIRYALIFSGQMWAKSFAQTVSFFILPIITYVITKTIYGNIALSLGMIGALSIVRFRHPVKSALELIIYFDLITIGIAASVKNNYAIILSLLTVVILISLKVVNNIQKKNNKKSFYNVSFNEGLELNQIEVISSKKIDVIENNNNLKSVLNDNESNDYIYRLVFEDKIELQNFKNEIENLEGLKKIDVSYI